MSMRFPVFVLLFLAWSMTGRTDFELFDHLAEADLERLRLGEWIVESESSTDHWATASVVIFMPAPPERIWNTIINCRDAFVFVDGLEYCEVLEERGDFALTRQIVDKGWTVPQLEFTFETKREPYHHMEFDMVEGNMKVMRGSWDFKLLEDGTLVRYTLILQPLFPAPRWLVRRNMKRDLPGMLRCIRGLVADGPLTASVIQDRQQCPGELSES